MTAQILSQNDIKLGMKVAASQLKEIYDKYMILLYDTAEDKLGTLVYFNDVQDDSYTEWFEQSKPITPIYNSKDELEDMSVYDE